MEAKIKHIGTKTVVQTSSVKMCDFFDLFRVYKWIDFALEKVLSRLPPPSARNPNPAKLHSPNSSFLKMLLTFQSRLLAFKRWLKSLNQKKPTGWTFWKRFSISIKLLHKLSFKKWCLQWSVKCSWGTCPLVYLFRFASVVNFDRIQLIHSVKSAKCRKRSQRKSISFT